MRTVSISDRYEATEGPVLLSGIEALVRLLLTQRRLDLLRHLSTALFISGYEGSPLGGLDQQLQRAHDLLADADIVFTPGLNEELAATAVGGTQLTGELPGRRVDGCRRQLRRRLWSRRVDTACWGSFAGRPGPSPAAAPNRSRCPSRSRSPSHASTHDGVTVGGEAVIAHLLRPRRRRDRGLDILWCRSTAGTRC